MIKVHGRLRGTREKVLLAEVKPNEVDATIKLWSNSDYICSTSA